MPRSQMGRPTRGGLESPGNRVWKLAVLAGAVLVLNACEGQTLYDLPTEPGVPGQPRPPGTARGELVNIPGVGIIADMVVDPATQRVFLSNHGQHQLEVLNLEGLTFHTGGVPVGSRPWGLSRSREGNTVIVANSGGSNVSFVSTTALEEDIVRRFEIPRVNLYEYVEQVDTIANSVSIEIRYFNYADRPQFIAQDAQGRLVYSATSTQASPGGTLRLAEIQPGWETWNTRLLFADGSVSSNPRAENRAVTGADDVTAVANLDSMTLVWREVNGIRLLTGEVVMFDHRPGTLPTAANHLIRSDTVPFFTAFQQMRTRGSDVVIFPGHSWLIPGATAIADTTFVTASADHQWIAVGEGLGEGAGRILIWGAGSPGQEGALSRVEDVRDILNNTSDRVFGVDLNANGTLGAARGAFATYFFGRDLRLQGSTAAAAGGSRGIGFLGQSQNNRTLAFEPTGDRTLRILETTHYRVVGEFALREMITGPFRVGPPRPGTTACPPDFRQGLPECVVATAYGVTDRRRLQVADILHRDIP
jgi:hypothetical protein